MRLTTKGAAELGLVVKKKARQKYGNEAVVGGSGEHFDSRHEFRRWGVLRGMQMVGDISDLRRQVRYPLIPAAWRPDGVLERECAYVADFVYVRDGQVVVEDAKSEPTRKRADYVIKRKLMLHVHGIAIKEVTNK